MENLKYQVVTYVLVWVILTGYFGYLYVRIGRLRAGNSPERSEDSVRGEAADHSRKKNIH